MTTTMMITCKNVYLLQSENREIWHYSPVHDVYSNERMDINCDGA